MSGLQSGIQELALFPPRCVKSRKLSGRRLHRGPPYPTLCVGIGAKHDFVPARHAKAGGSAYLCRLLSVYSCVGWMPKPLRSECRWAFPGNPVKPGFSTVLFRKGQSKVNSCTIFSGRCNRTTVNLCQQSINDMHSKKTVADSDTSHHIQMATP